MKTIGLVLLSVVCFYVLQYVAVEIHFACKNPLEDCPPPIYLAGELVYRIIVQPPWLGHWW